MGRPASFFDVKERLGGLSRKGDDLEATGAWSTSSCFAGARACRAAGRTVEGRRAAVRPRADVQGPDLETQNNLSDERTGSTCATG